MRSSIVAVAGGEVADARDLHGNVTIDGGGTRSRPSTSPYPEGVKSQSPG
jgi:hypothetical protein